jgi:hypothetical protein
MVSRMILKLSFQSGGNIHLGAPEVCGALVTAFDWLPAPLFEGAVTTGAVGVGLGVACGLGVGVGVGFVSPGMLILICAEAEAARAVTKNRAAIVVTFLIFIFSKDVFDSPHGPEPSWPDWWRPPFMEGADGFKHALEFSSIDWLPKKEKEKGRVPCADTTVVSDGGTVPVLNPPVLDITERRPVLILNPSVRIDVAKIPS